MDDGADYPRVEGTPDGVDCSLPVPVHVGCPDVEVIDTILVHRLTTHCDERMQSSDAKGHEAQCVTQPAGCFGMKGDAFTHRRHWRYARNHSRAGVDEAVIGCRCLSVAHSSAASRASNSLSAST